FFDNFDYRPESSELVRTVGVGTRRLASSTVAATRLVQAPLGPSATSVALVRGAAGVVCLGFLGIALVVPGRGRRRRAGPSVLVGAFLLAQLPALPVAQATGPPDAAPTVPTVFYHLDHLRSPRLLTNEGGVVLEYLVHRPYGESGGHLNASGSPRTPASPFD